MTRLSPKVIRGLKDSFLLPSLIRTEEARLFPEIAFEVAGKSTVVKDSRAYLTSGGKQESWLLLGFRAFSQQALDTWRGILTEAEKRLPIYELTVNERLLDRLLVGFQKQLLPAGSLIYTPSRKDKLFTEFLSLLHIENRFSAYVYFLDRSARVRWRAVGVPPEGAATCVATILRDHFGRN
jgi:hypothetical protein